MAWSTPLTAVTLNLLTAAQYNASVRDNLAATAPPIATTPGSHFVATGANKLAERIITSDVVNTAEQTSATSYSDMATVGPRVTVTTGASAIVLMQARCRNVNGNGRFAAVTFEVSGATSIIGDDNWSVGTGGILQNNPQRIGVSRRVTTLNAGSNTFTMRYKCQAGYTPAQFEHRELVVIPL